MQRSLVQNWEKQKVCAHRIALVQYWFAITELKLARIQEEEL
jgi:hypothetical protein